MLGSNPNCVVIISLFPKIFFIHNYVHGILTPKEGKRATKQNQVDTEVLANIQTISRHEIMSQFRGCTYGGRGNHYAP